VPRLARATQARERKPTATKNHVHIHYKTNVTRRKWGLDNAQLYLEELLVGRASWAPPLVAGKVTCVKGRKGMKDSKWYKNTGYWNSTSVSRNFVARSQHLDLVDVYLRE
jgi:hypothetical protein